MRTQKMPEPPGQGGRAKQLNTNYKPLHITTIPKVSKQKLHWSRKHNQRELDRSLLAIFGLEFKKVPGTNFHRLGSRKEVA